VGSRTLYEDIGVADWPLETRHFQFMRGARRDREKNRFNALLDRLGYHRADWGTDADHVWDLYLQGGDWDRFDNLWPASDQEQRLAGSRHERQIRNYEQTLGNVNGRHFRIVRERHPA
jgi:hypothetical protein